MKKEKIFMDVTEVAEVLDVSESYAYKLIRKMNVELKENGFISDYSENKSGKAITGYHIEF